MVKQVDEQSEFDELVAKGPVIIDFTATWCGPCKMIGPVFVDLAEDAGNLTFIKVDVDAAEDISSKCGISAMPTFQVWKDGKKIDELVGASKDKLAALVAKHK
jgi:thioredoxin 1